MSSCTTCGSNLPCGCRSTNRYRSCGSCGGAPCNCGNIVPAGATPYYACNSQASPQSHSQKITVQQFYADISVSSSWNVPVCGGSANIVVQGLKSIAIGSYILSAEFGYFEVTAFDSATETVTVKNNCTDGNAAPGTQIPECSLFIISPPPPPNENVTGNCVEIDFTAPEVDVPLDITLTSTDGIAPGYSVTIGDGVYFVSAVKANNVITIVNKGEGIAPGTSVIAKDEAGNYNYCLGIIAENACTKDAVLAGSIIVCDELSQQPLKAAITSNEGIVVAAVLTGEDDVEAEYQPLDVDVRRCTVLEAVLAIVNGDATYTIDVATPSIFQTGDVIEIEGMSGTAEVTAVGGSTLDITITPTPDSSYNLDSGNWVCARTCCDENAADILDIKNAITIQALQTGGLDAGIIDSGSPNLSFPNQLNWNVTNNSELTVRVQYQFSITCTKYNADISGGVSLVSQLNLRYQKNAESPITGSDIQAVFIDTLEEVFTTQKCEFFLVDSLLPGVTNSYNLQANISWLGPASGGSGADSAASFPDYSLEMTYIKLPV